jgi:hypothetical protein
MKGPGCSGAFHCQKEPVYASRCMKDSAVDRLLLERLHEALCLGIVIRIAEAAHARLDRVRGAPRPVPLRPVRCACGRASCGGCCREVVEGSGSPGMKVVPRIFADHRTSIRKKAGIKRDLSESSLCDAHVARQENQMSHEQKDRMHDLDRDRCALVAGVPRSSLPSP